MRKPKFRHPEYEPSKPLHLHDMPVGAFVVIVCRKRYGAHFAYLPQRVVEHLPEGVAVEDIAHPGRISRPIRTIFTPSAPGYWTRHNTLYIHSVHDTLEAAHEAQKIVNGPYAAYCRAVERADAAFARIRALALPGHLWNVAAAEKRAADLEFLVESWEACR